jgi:hypothetical protein
MQTRRDWLGGLATCGLALGLTIVFWLPIWRGAGFVGGDIYSYFFPQKVIYAEALRAGELPLWNDRAGFGYPLLAESQTGIFYPPNLVLYWWLDPHSAFHVSFLLHYFLAFVFASAAAQRIGLSRLPSWLSALIYVYGWFPPRTCVEWAILGGTWLPAALWCAEGFLATRWWRYAIGLSGVLAVQLLAGHFQIAWFTLLLLAAYVPARVWWLCDERSEVRGQGLETHRWRRMIVSFGAMACGLCLAAVQLLPTYELKSRSQRATVGAEHELDFGSIPPWYWTQLVWPSHWYSPLTDREEAFRKRPPLGHARTNSAEAHLYLGVAPLVVILAGIGQAWRERTRRTGFWLAVAGLSSLYTSGWLLPLTQPLPGFSYFQGPGRYGLLTTWGAAVLAGFVAERFLREPVASRWLSLAMLAGSLWSLSTFFFLADDVAAMMAQVSMRNPLQLGLTEAQEAGPLRNLWQLCLLVGLMFAVCCVWWWRAERPNPIDARLGLIGLLMATTAVEFWTISRLVTFTQIVESPPLKQLEQSPARQRLLEIAKSRPTLRLFAPGANLPSTLGVSSVPVYLTFGPAEYVDPALRMPESPPEVTAVPATPEQIDWMRRCGVTHVLSFEPPAQASELKLVWQGDDPFLNRTWGRPGQPLHLYELHDAPGRVQFEPSTPAADDRCAVTRFDSTPDQVVCEVHLPGDGVLVLTDLDYPGWSVAVDGQPTELLRARNQFRGVRLTAGVHRVVWTFQPRSQRWGAAVSLLTLLVLAAVAHVRFWHPTRLPWLDDESPVSRGEVTQKPG